MSDIMRPIKFKDLLTWATKEYETQQSIFTIPEGKFYYKKDKAYFEIFGEKCETAIGPAAGPATQQAMNLAVSYLTGGRFFELKTVQILDSLEIEKPCIDIPDEGYNTEWSTEFSVPEAFDEYVKGWFLVHVLDKMLGISQLDERGFVFNMSVGYDLEGIKTPKIDNFIEGLKDASETAIFQECVNDLKTAIEAGQIPNISNPAFADSISPKISKSITLSTMHGTPPDEQEGICRYLIGEKKVHTFVKLNPTLLGYDYVRDVFDRQEFDHIEMKPESFEHDMKYDDAVQMIRSLKAFAKENGVDFGVKLTNTLAVINDGARLPTGEMYMSGRALYPLTVNLCNKLAQEFKGDLAISYSGGATYHNIDDLFTSGIKPITLATDLLKPGGYSRLNQLSNVLERPMAENPSREIDLEKLQSVADNAIVDEHYHKESKPSAPMKTDQKLGLLDCFVAPCVVACPVHQDVPEYIQLIAEERFADAYELIISSNAMPFVTGYICESACELKCVRNDYEETVRIRDLKRIASERGFDEVMSNLAQKVPHRDAKVAIIGAGPAGLSSAYFLGREGFDVTVFDKTDKIGGMVTHGIADYRVPDEAIENDVELVKKMGATFELNCDPKIDVQKLKDDGFKYVHLAIGAWKSRDLPIEGETDKVLGAIKFLTQFTDNPAPIRLGKNVAVIGAGNSAMDAARAALRITGVENVYIVYRRSRKEMPATREEFLETTHDGAVFHELVNPVSLHDGVLKCQQMKLGEKDTSGRRRPIPVEGDFVDFEIDTVITAIGELVEYELLEANQLIANEKGDIPVNKYHETDVENVYLGGDAYRGPSSIIEAIADGRAVAEGIIEKENVTHAPIKTADEYDFDTEKRFEEIAERKAEITSQVALEEFDIDFSTAANRCLSCNIVCNKCVEVCPNIANIPIKVENFTDPNQILHIEGLCNECGNCAVFCPYDSDPAKDKFTLYWTVDEFEKGEHEGYVYTSENTLKMRHRSDIYDLVLENGDIRFSDSTIQRSTEIDGVLKMISTVETEYPYLLHLDPVA
ncbi:MAG: putative selenate reductase subunit YgfK [Anaerolineae bacterium]|jgi:putative selenate reductase|nr:putative selenate reductase subunit YgfK [Anaerolineae bacterium]MBT4309858.1 putative selenate reductase subunit YgfK [Anaerolineae bacterium]MBT4457527.1 putative selenate reductase subunit YgfK [Anaerolineae bacterium]MBT4843608.1 putative selenate reductase subunit YgfK [Anaerolineae bacterium]MBT6060764.1 putative selenate reductase subunit YgfK [Anaerolineae bacterium]